MTAEHIAGQSSQRLYDLALRRSSRNLIVWPNELRRNLITKGFESGQVDWLEASVITDNYLWKQISSPDPKVQDILYLGFRNKQILDNNPKNAMIAFSVTKSSEALQQLNFSQVVTDSTLKRRFVETTYNLKTNRLVSMYVGIGLNEATLNIFRDLLVRKCLFNKLEPAKYKPTITSAMLSTIERQEENLALIKVLSLSDPNSDKITFVEQVEGYGFKCEKVGSEIFFRSSQQRPFWEIKVPASLVSTI